MASIAEELQEVKSKINEVEEQAKHASGEEKVALQQQLAALRQEKVLLMQREAGACCCPQHNQLFSMQRQKAAAARLSVLLASAVSADSVGRAALCTGVSCGSRHVHLS